MITGIMLAYYAVHWFLAISLFIAVLYYLCVGNLQQDKIVLLLACGAWGFLSIHAASISFAEAQKALPTFRTVTGWVCSLEQSSIPHYKWRMQLYIEGNKKLEGFYLDIFLRKRPRLLVNDKINLPLPAQQAGKKNDDLMLFSRKGKVLQTFFLKSIRPRLLYRPYLSVSRFCARLKNKILALIKTHLSSTTAKLVSAMVLGYKIARDHEWFDIQDNMQKWGIVHYLARSGLHVTLVIILLLSILGWIPLHIRIKRLAAVLLLTIFALLTWMSVSFQRALTTFFLGIFAQSFYLPIQSLQLLCASALLICIINPWHIFFLDFQLSFLMTGLLILFFDRQHHRIVERIRMARVR